MKYYSMNEIVKQGWANYAQLNRASATPINVRFCRDCPKFDIDGLQPVPGIVRGSCLRMSDENVPFYVDVTDRDFCNEDNFNEVLQ